jgi:hypothetical protein
LTNAGCRIIVGELLVKLLRATVFKEKERTMKSKVVWCAIALAALLVTSALAADINGKWTAQIAGRGGQTNETTFNFKVDGDKLTGAMSGRQGADIPISDGKVTGDEISFTTKMSRGGNEMKFLFKGKVVGDEIKFTREMEGGQGQGQPQEFTAKKATS